MPSTKRPAVKKKMPAPVPLDKARARAIWLTAQGLTAREPFGAGPEAVRRTIEHLGYVQIDTINVIERCHHHILYNRIPAYTRADLHHAQSEAKTVFEYWTHALSFVPVRDFRHFVATMKRHRREPSGFSAQADRREIARVLRRIREEGPLTISDITDDKLVEKNHPWASRKPSKRALQAGFYNGELVIARREGMLKTYELTERHFGWERLPKPATQNQTNQYLLDRALTAQGLVSLDSICHLNAKAKPAVAALIDKHVRARRLVPVAIEGYEKVSHWARPGTLEAPPETPTLIHILSPFDPMIIQRKRTAMIFDYEHVFEAYVPKDKRRYGYFTLPVLDGAEIVAALDLKADRQNGTLRVQAWHWIGNGNAADHKQRIDAELDRFARFQFAGDGGE